MKMTMTQMAKTICADWPEGVRDRVGRVKGCVSGWV